MGKFSGNAEDIPHGAHKPGAVKFKEAEDPKQMGKTANAWALGISLVCMAAYSCRAISAGLQGSGGGQWLLGLLLFALSLFPHELLHGLCFREDVYLYTDLRHGLLFVTGPEDMSKGWFVFMSLLPSLVFGLIPFAVGMLWPRMVALGVWGALALGAGAGDYYNVFHALTQMPKGARTYLYQFNSWWYLPEKTREEEE